MITGYTVEQLRTAEDAAFVRLGDRRRTVTRC